MKTASVATFGQQGNYNTIGGGQSCTSPTTLSPPPQKESPLNYQQREEKLDEPRAEEDTVVKMPKAGRKVPSASSVVNKFINAAVERRHRTS